MKTDIALFKLFFDRETFNKCFKFIRFDLIEREVQQILSGLKEYYSKFNVDTVNVVEFRTWFFLTKIPNTTEDVRSVFDFLFDRLDNADIKVSSDYIKKIFEIQLAKQFYQELDQNKFSLETFRSYLDDYERTTKEAEDSIEYEDNSLDNIEQDLSRKDGLKWRLKGLNEAIGPLKKGDFGVVAAYVDCGKTKFAISEATHMAQQIEDGCVLWLNNEEYNPRVLQRIWTSTLNSKWESIVQNKEEAKKVFAHKMNGDLNRIKLIDIRKYSLDTIKYFFKVYNPKLVIVDQIDKINHATRATWKEHDRLKSLYGEFRNLANEYCPIIAICQADASSSKVDPKTNEVTYSRYLDMRQLDGSKVGKQGEADFIITIGMDLDLPNSRFINVPKNKLGAKQRHKQEVYFDGERSIYKDS